MISSSALLLLLGAMVSQVFSRPVLLVVFDGINDEFMSKMPELNKGGEVGKLIARPGVLKTENPTKPFPLLHTIATGVLPNVHGVIANAMFNREGKKMFNKKEQFMFNQKLIPIWTEALLNGIPTATIKWPGANFAVKDKTPVISEIYQLDKPTDVKIKPSGSKSTLSTKQSPPEEEFRKVTWDSQISIIKKWFTDDGIKFGMAYFEDTNAKVPVDVYIKKAYDAIQNLYKELKDIDVDIIIVSSHGKKEIEFKKILNMDDYLQPNQCKCHFLVAGGISFVRFQNTTDLERIYEQLKRVDLDNDKQPDHGTKYEVFKRDEEGMAEWNLKDFALLENTLFVTAINGHTFYNTHKRDNAVSDGANSVRENGYTKTDADMDSILLLIGTSFKDNVVAEKAEIQITEVYQLIKKLLGLKNKASSKQRVKDLSDDMKQLIEDDTLAAWDKK